MMTRRKAGISPVVATVILVAVAIVIAIAVAFWASGLVGVFTRFEKIEIQAAYWDTDASRVIVIAKNSGSSPTVVDMILVNGLPCTSGLDDALSIGQTRVWSVSVGATCVRTGGITNEIALHTTSGKTYPVAVLVP
jgi:FlaG/FlaF family flagellin (archaellin)